MTLEVKQLSFGYKDRAILHNLTFTAQPQDLLCVLGPNGVGKSTLFRCMLGLIKHYEGTVIVSGKNVKKMRPVELAKNIAYIPQSHHPTFNFTVLNMVLMGGTVHLGQMGNPKAEDEEKAWQALDMLGISHLGHRGYAEISGGERQLALIARAIVQQAKILFMDEPTANLDYGNQMRVMMQVKELAKQGYTIILSTHNPEHAFLYGNKALVMFQGKMIELGDPKEVLTEALLQHVYGVNVKLIDIDTEEGKSRLIVPCLKQKEKKNVYLD